MKKKYLTEKQKDLKDLRSIYITTWFLSIIFYLELLFIFFIIVYVVTVKSTNAYTNYESALNIIWKILVGLEITKTIGSIVLFFMVLFHRSKIVKAKLKVLAILSLIPAISFITFFIMKWKIKKIYKEIAETDYES